jgi:ATP:ADP antiporter, AAA family
MKNNFWLRALNVRPDEGWVVKKLFILQFLQGAGIAFFFTAAFALFLSRFPITELPYVFIYSSLLLWIIGFIYSKIEHKFRIDRLAIIITVFMIASFLFFRFAFAYIKEGWFLYWMLAWFNVLYLLNNLEFWGVASTLFNVRQSKRLFGVISAGDIPAKFLGYTLALFTVEYIGTINLLWAGIVCLAASIPFLISIKRSGKLVDLQHIPKHRINKNVPKVSKIVHNFSGNVLIRRLAGLSIIVSASFIIINFAFYAGVKEAYADDVSLAKFIAMFLAIVRIIAMVVKMIFTSRLINKLGIIKSLLITPLVLLLLMTVIIATQDMSNYKKILLYLFGFTSIFVDILRTSINSPVFLTIMQPLSSHERLKAHTIVKGIMDPFASLFSGVILLIMIRYEQEVDLLSLSYLLLAICFFWIIGIYRVNSQYLKTVVKTLSSRYFNQEHLNISDSGTLLWLKEKAGTGSETEIINILNLLYKSENTLSDDLLVSLLRHPSVKVKREVLKLIRQKDFKGGTEFLVPFLHDANDPSIIAEAIHALCKNGVHNHVIEPFLQNNNREIRQAAISGLVSCAGSEEGKKASLLLQQLCKSPDIRDRMMAAEILSSTGGKGQDEMIITLMNDVNAEVRRSAFSAASGSADTRLLQELMFRIGTDELPVVQSLFTAGEPALPVIHAYVSGSRATASQKERLILLMGSIGGKSAHGFLLDLLDTNPDGYMTIIKALYRSNYSPKASEQEVFLAIAKKLLAQAAELIYMQESLERGGREEQLMVNSFVLELESLRDSILYVFAVLYDRETINKVRTAYATGKKESIINAMEIIDIAVRKDLSNRFNILFEPCTITEKIEGLRSLYPPEAFDDVKDILESILEKENRPYNNWTTACSLYVSKTHNYHLDNKIIKKYTVDENYLVRETALFAI